ncbi:GIY-YIG nuclease family protein [Caulobacter sp. 1776]|uniref:GIY-YIG nuclease family protein n=1 Tax=Caulobacter sp. 1776 TaxID=3156420 RepID=UPI003390E654
MDQMFAVYILASRPYGTLYCGHTDDLPRRVWEHKEKVHKGFTAKYGVNRLVWYEMGDTREGAFARERQVKKWNRAWKIELIEALNPGWADLYETLNC